MRGVTRTAFEARPDEAALEDLRRRLVARRTSPLGGAWELGVPDDWLEDLLVQWADSGSAALLRRLAGVEQWMVDVRGQAVHTLHVPGTGPDPLPLVLTNGWPSSLLEHLEVAQLLADPASHGGDPADAFSVVLPSLPGFGWSDPPPVGGTTAAEIADLWRDLMVDGFGYPRFAAHGSDLGAGVTAWLARRHPDATAAIHLATPSLAVPSDARTAGEDTYRAEVAAWAAEEGAYAHVQATKPATLAAALVDSPAGLAAWVGEKVRAWSSVGTDGEPAFPRQLLLDTLTLFWCTGTIGTSMLPYWRYRRSPDAALPVDEPPEVPTAVSVFGGELVPFPRPPRTLADRYFRVVAWNDEPTGGHFPAVAAPQRLATILRDTLRPYRLMQNSHKAQLRTR